MTRWSNTQELLNNIKTTDIKNFQNGEVCLHASSCLYIHSKKYLQFYREIYGKEVDKSFFKTPTMHWHF